MIDVMCTVKPVKEDESKVLVVNSVEKGYGVIQICIGNVSMMVDGSDLITSVENCMQNGRRRSYRGYRKDEDEL